MGVYSLSGTASMDWRRSASGVDVAVERGSRVARRASVWVVTSAPKEVVSCCRAATSDSRCV